MRSKLVSGDEKWGFDVPRVVLGRGENCDVLVTDPVASRHHAELWLDYYGQYMVMDCGSRNGTFLNDTMVCGPLPLKQADVIRIGEQTFEFNGNTTSQSLQATSMIKAGQAQSLPKFPVVMLAIRLIDDKNFLANEMLAYSCGVGQWFVRQMKLIADKEGRVNHIGQRTIFAFWKAEGGELAEALGKAVSCARESMLITKALDEEFKMALDGVNNQQLMDTVVALHLGKVEGRQIASSDLPLFTMSGAEVESCLDVSEKAGSSLDSLVCLQSVSKLFSTYPKKSLGNFKIGPRQLDSELIQVKI